MAYKGSQPFKITLEAGADLSAKQYYFVKLDATGKAVVCPMRQMPGTVFGARMFALQ